MKIALCTLAYNEADYIGAHIKNWQGLVDEHLVLVSSKPWNGPGAPDDGTADIARSMGARVMTGDWETEAQQRNQGIAELYDYDYVIMLDPDEFITKVDQKTLFDFISQPYERNWRTDKMVPAWPVQGMITYWKTPDYILTPADKHHPTIVIDPKQIICLEHRQFSAHFAKVIPISIHHMSWAKTDAKVEEKIRSFSHADDIRKGWYKNVWLKWQPGDETEVRPYGNEKSKAVYTPAPQEIKDLIEKK